MTDKMLNLVKEEYALTQIDAGEFSTLKANGMTFTVKAYCVEGLGHLSIMKAKGFLGLMRMDTLMIVPKEKDLPLYSYDRIYAMGNDTLIVELYNTLTEELDLTTLDHIKAKYSHIPQRDPGEHWYDRIKLPQSISQKGKKSHSAELDALTLEHFFAYLHTPACEVSDSEKKYTLSAQYVYGLLEQGGPSTDAFKKALGRETTETLFKNVLFGIE